MKPVNKRHRILKVEKRVAYKVTTIVNWPGGAKIYSEIVDTFYSVITKKGCVAQNLPQKCFNAKPQPGMFIRLCRNKQQFEITGRNGR